MTTPWTKVEIDVARKVSFEKILEHLGAYCKRDHTFLPVTLGRKSIRLQVNLYGNDYCFILTGEKWVNELRPKGDPNRGGGGAIDFVSHLTGVGFIEAVRICLTAGGRQE